MNAAELIRYCRKHRSGVPEGSIADPAVLRDVLMELLEMHLEDLAEHAARNAPPLTQHAGTGKLVPSAPAPAPLDPRDDSTARALATLIGYLEDR